MRIDDTDSQKSDEAIFVCGKCGHRNLAPENRPPSHCGDCGAHIGKHIVKCENDDPEDATRSVGDGRARIALRRRLSN